MNQEATPYFVWMPSTETTLTTDQTSQNSLMQQIEANYLIFIQLYLENQTLRTQLTNIKHQNSILLQQNQSLRSQRTDKSLRSKRRYSKRRTWLNKEFCCPYSDCEGKYSSKIALNNHLRKKHPLHHEQQ